MSIKDPNRAIRALRAGARFPVNIHPMHASDSDGTEYQSRGLSLALGSAVIETAAPREILGNKSNRLVLIRRAAERQQTQRAQRAPATKCHPDYSGNLERKVTQ